MQIYIEGMPRIEAYLNDARQPAASLKVNVTALQLLGSKNDPITEVEKQ